MSRVPRRCVLALVCVALLAVLPTGSAPAQESIYGRTKISAPERTDAGDWYGTWFFVSRSRKMAVWFRLEDDGPKMRIRLQEQASGLEGFTTDWEGHASYGAPGKAGRFDITWVERSENTFSGVWTWNSDRREGGYTETARFEIYRSGSGRQLVWKVEDFVRKYRGGGSTEPVRSERIVWTLRKTSRREALWAELPF